MPSMEAMRLYVRTLEEELPEWWGPEVATAMEAAASEINGDDSSNTTTATASTNGGPGSDSQNSNIASSTNTTTTTAAAAANSALHTSKSSVNPVSSVKSRSVAEVVVEGSWVSPYIASDHRPPPRFEQSMALIGNYLYVVGGNCGGRYLADTWALNLENLSWKCISTGKITGAASSDQEGGQLLSSWPIPPIAGHATVPWNGNVVCIGGHTKSKDEMELPVRILDTQSDTWSTLSTTCAASVHPRPRGGHSATAIGNKVYVFGGEDARRKALNELWVLDLSTLEWTQPETTTSGGSSASALTARSQHTSCSFRNRYIIIFGGGSVANCYNDLAVLDTQTMEWSFPTAEGPVPPPRAGHAAAVLGTTLYTVGGGNNARGCADMYALDLSNLGLGGGSATGENESVLRWVLVGNTPADAAISSEGLSLLTVPMAGCMVSFGGYNGKYHNAVHVYRPEGFVVVKPGSASGAGGHLSGAASAQKSLGRREVSEAPSSNAANTTTTTTTTTTNARSSQSDLESARREAAAAKEAVSLEISIMRRQLDSATSALAEAERAAEEAKEALATEQQKSISLEVEVAELRQKLVAMGEMERELARYTQREAEETAKKPGIWGFITGADQTPENTIQ